MSQRALVTLFLSLILNLGALAQGAGSTSLIQYADGQQVEWKDDGVTAPGEILMQFLNSGKDGKMTVMEDGQTSFVIDKAGQQVTLSSPTSPTETMTIQQLIDTLREKPEPAENPGSSPREGL
jgi:hypothetical protein